MDTWTSDFIISISVIIGAIAAKMLPKKVKLVWRTVIALVVVIFFSVLGHIIVKICQ